jgi:subtilisin family serine protease
MRESKSETMFVWVACISAVFFGFSFNVSAQSDLLPSELETALNERERVRVIVQFDIPLTAYSDADDAERESQIAQMDAARDAIIERALGRSAATLASNPISVDRPALIHEYRYSPAAAMYLSRAEINALANDPAVFRILLDQPRRPQLDTSISHIGARSLHDIGLTGAGVGVAILDTGVDHQHPMFAGRITASACFSSSDPAQNVTGFCPNGQAVDTTSPEAGDNCEELSANQDAGGDGCFHGTHVAGIAAGSDFANPDLPTQIVRGVAPAADIIAVQVFARFAIPASCHGQPACAQSFPGDQLRALEWLYDNRATLKLASINMSLGGGQNRYACDSDPLVPIIRLLRTAGIATVIASGNDGNPDTIGAPACISDAITVGSSTDEDTLSGFSNSGIQVDLVAPGSGILSASPTANDTGAPGVRNSDGTSMATPHVAGAFALLRAAYPTASVSTLENALESTGLPIASARSNIFEPRIRLDRANAELAAHRQGNIGNLNVSPIFPLDATVTLHAPTSGIGSIHTLTNTGASPLSWTVSSDAAWLAFFDALSADGGNVEATQSELGGVLQPGESRNLTVQANGTGLAPGIYQTSYQIAVDGLADPLQVAASLAVLRSPANDNFASSSRLVFNSQALADTTAASRENGEPTHAGSGTGPSVWYKWTAEFSGSALIATQAINGIDPVIAVYTGNSVGSLTSIAANDNAEAGSTDAGVLFDAVAGTTYYIAVGGASSSAGEARVLVTSIAPPANDDVDSAQVIAGASGRVTSTLQNATAEDGEPAHAGLASENSVWFMWTAPSAGPVWFDPTSGIPSTRIAIYNSQEQTVVEGSNTAVSFNAVSGAMYLIAIDRLAGNPGIFDLSWAMNSAANHRLAAAVLPTIRTGQTGQLTTALATLINPARFGVDGQNCRLDPPPDFVGDFAFQTTDSATNQASGQPDTPVDIPSGAAQSFVFGVTSTSAVSNIVLQPVFRCDNIRPSNSVLDVTTLRLTADEYANADIISIAQTASQDGIASVPLNGVTAFAVAAVNIGIGQSPVYALLQPLDPNMSLIAGICETDPASGQCLAPPNRAVQTVFATNDVRTFSVFVRGVGDAISFSPSENRYSVIFLDANETRLGGTSVAVRTVPDP